MKRTYFLLLLVLIALSLGITVNISYAQTTFLVLNNNDSGTDSFREALTLANASLGTDTIEFAIPAAPFTIDLASPLPAITDPVFINGLSQGTTCDAPLIELNGVGAGLGVDGLTITAGPTVVQGLVIRSFSSAGIRITAGSGNTIQCNFIGTDATGVIPAPNLSDGIVISTDNNIIGTGGLRNLISNNGGNGIFLLTGGAFNNNIVENTISNNVLNGIQIGLAPNDPAAGNHIAENLIFNNGSLGIDLGGDGITPNIAGDADIGANLLQNFPVLTAALASSSTIDLSGTLNSTPGTTFEIDFYTNPTCDGTHGEGEVYLGSFTPAATNGAGNTTFATTFFTAVALGDSITATATNLATFDTSEFSACVTTTVATPIFSSTSPTTISVTTPVGVPLTPSVEILVENTGNATLDVASVVLAGDTAQVTSTNTAFFIPAGGSTPYTIECQSSTAGTFTTTFTFNHNGASTPDVYTVICDVTSPIYNSSPIAVNGLIDLGTTPQGVPISTTLNISNTGTANLTVSSTVLTGGANGLDFSVTAGLPLNLIPGDDADITITCTPSDVGLRVGTLTLQTNDPALPSGNAIYNVQCTTGTPGYDSNPVPNATIAVGSAVVGGTPASTTLQIIEAGNADLIVNTGAPVIDGPNAADFSITPASPFPLTLIGGSASTSNVTITCDPSVVGPLTATLHLTSNDPTNATIDYPLTCNGIGTPGYDSNPLPNATIAVGSAVVGGTPASTTLQIIEAGSADLVVNTGAPVIDGPNAADFSITPASPFPLTLIGGSASTSNVTITCDPSVVGPLTATLHLTSNDPANLTIDYPLTCTGTAAPTPGYNSNPIPNATIPVGSAVVGGTPVSTTLQIIEAGSADLVVNTGAPVIDGPNAADFSITPASPFPLTLIGGSASTSNVTITCDPSVVGPLTATLHLTSNDPANLTIDYPLTCTGTAAPTPGYNSNPIPNATIPVGSAVVGGTPVSTTLQIIEAGSADLVVNTGAPVIDGPNAADFSITPASPFPLTLIGGSASTSNVTITCDPSVTGPLTATLHLTSNDPANLTIDYPLTCTGTAAPTPGYNSNPIPNATIPVGSAVVGGTPVSTTLQIIEAGSADLVVNTGAPVIDGPNAADFSITPASPFPLTLIGGSASTSNVTITCDPSVVGPLTATLHLTSNDPANLTIDYPLTCTGTGVPPIYSSVPAPTNPINFPPVALGTPTQATLAVTNIGGGTLTVNFVSITGPNAGDFTIFSGLPMNNNGGPAQNIIIECIPSTIALVPGTVLTLSTNDPSLATVTYPLNCVGTVTGAGYSSILPPGSLINVGSTSVGGIPATTNISVRETGTATLTVSNPSITGANFGDFALTTVFPMTILDNGVAQNINIRCIPTAVGLRTATLTLTTNDSTQTTVTYTLNCTGTPATAAGYASSPVPNATINMTSVVGSGVTVTLVVSETGAGTLLVTPPGAGVLTGANAAEFSLIAGAPPFSILDGGAPQTVTIRCIPTAVGQRIATLTFNTNDPLLPTVIYNLSCVGTSVTDANATATPLGGILPTATITIPMSPTPTPLGPAAGQVIEVRGLAVRTGPYLGATIIGVIRPGATYAILARSQDEGIYTWYLINIGNNEQGWVSGRYFQTSGNLIILPSQGSIFDSIDGAPDTGVTATARAIIDIRRRPSGRATILTQIPRGATVSVIGRTMQGGVFWLHIRYNGVVGWVPAAPVNISGSLDNVPIR